MSKNQPWPIPDHWQWFDIGDKTEVVGGGTPSTKDDSNYDDGPIPWIIPADLSGYKEKYIQRGRRNITEKGLNGSGARLMPEGTVLFSSRAPIGYVAIASNPVTTNQGFKSFVPQDDVSPEYLYYYLKRAKELALKLASGTTFPEISGKNARRIPLPLPPVDEQKEIVAAIETQFARLDDAIAALQRSRTRLKRYRASVLKAACEGRLVPTEAELARQEFRSYEPASVLLARIKADRESTPGKKRKKANNADPVDASQFPDLPDGWAWTSIGDCFDVYVGATPSRKEPSYWDGDIPWVSSGEVAFCSIRSTRETITELGLQKTSTSLHPPGTVLVGMIGEGKTRGQVAMLTIDACNNQNSAAIRVSETPIQPWYVYRFLEGQYEETRRGSSGNNQPALNKARVQAIRLPLPPLVLCHG